VAVAEAPPAKDMVSDPLADAVAREKLAAEREFEKAKEKKAEEQQRAALLEQARDEIELVQAQLVAKEADLRAAKAGLQIAQQSLGQIKALNERGAVSAGDLLKAQSEVTKAESDVIIKEAALQEPAVRLKQAQRRLKALEQAPAKASDAFTAEKFFAERSWDFGKVERGATVEHRFRLTNITEKPGHIASLRVNCGCATARVEREGIPSGEKTDVIVRLDTRRFVGPKTVHVYVLFDRPAPEEVVLEVKANSVHDSAPAGDEGKRLEQLEKKLDLLIDQLNDLRKEIRPK
jgi:hypothetical protein